MPWVAAAATVVGGMMSDKGGPGSNATQLPGMEGVAQNYQAALPGYMNQAQQYQGAMNPAFANQAFNAMYNNPYAGGVQGAANQAGQMAGQFAPMAQQAGAGAFGAGQRALDAGQQIWQTAQDPQNALFNRLQQQTMDQSNVTNSMYGLGGSGAGAGLAQQALGNFDINWQNQQLQRQMQGQQALGAGINQYGAANQQGIDMGMAGMGFQQQAGLLPYQAARGLGQDRFGAIGAQQQAMMSGLQPYQQNINNMGAYLGLGMGAQQQQLGAQQNQYANQQQNAANMAQLGTNLGMQYFGRGSTSSTPTYTNEIQH